ncbi:ribosome biogenesis protein Nop16 [Auriculariales sp. MPI-PUGE-AT-0066]|nr:ribosome biogenesis protein Nop16 [Auriculariales sp. MPI-PUGE-AT-0066]
MSSSRSLPTEAWKQPTLFAMANPRQRRKLHGQTKVKSSRRQKKNLKKMPPVKGPKALQEAWDRNKTIRQNYAALGLAETLDIHPTPGPSNAPALASASNTTTTSSSAQLPPGMGRILRDADGNVVKVILPDEIDLDAQPTPPQTQNTAVVSALEELASTSKAKLRYASTGERALMQELLRVHGPDYEAMARDRRRNTMQWTAGQLRRSAVKSGLAAY